jgi:ribosomal protein L22
MTEKNYSPMQHEKKVMKKQSMPVPTSKQKIDAPIKKDEKITEEEKQGETPPEKTDGKTEKPEEKKEKKHVSKIKKEFVEVNAKNVPVSTKYAVAICRFIKGKRIRDARIYLEEVVKLKKSIPMKGEFAHRKGPGKIASGEGKFPVKTSKHFITLLKSLAGNATNHDIMDPVISEAIANKASGPVGRFGRWKRKRTHITLRAINMPEKQKLKQKENKKKKK